MNSTYSCIVSGKSIIDKLCLSIRGTGSTQQRGARMPATLEFFVQTMNTSSCPGSQSTHIGVFLVILQEGG